MFNPKQFAMLVGILAAHDIHTNIQLYRATKASRTLKDEYVTYIVAQQERITYLCHMLAKNDIEFTEFDMIALDRPIFE